MWGVKRHLPLHAELTLEVGRIVDGLALGLHMSALKGKGVEFLGLRPYQSSDSPQQIDWMASARISDDDAELVTREFSPERKLSVLFLADESGSMRAPGVKPIYAESFLRMFALSAFATGDECAIIGMNADPLTYSGWMRNEESVDDFLRMSDDPLGRGGLRAPARTLSALFSDLDLHDVLVVVLTDASGIDSVPFRAFPVLPTLSRNVVLTCVVLDEWSGFEPSASLLPMKHPVSGKIAVMDMRKGGDVDGEVRAFRERLRVLREKGRPYGLRVFTAPLTADKPFVEFQKQWFRQWSDL